MRILKASHGNVLTDGTTYGKTVCLAPGADPDVWHEVTEQEAEAAAEAARFAEESAEKEYAVG